MPKLGETCNTYGPLKDRCLYSQSTSTTVNLLIISMMSMLSIASWNVHGLTKDLKKEQLVMDAKRYGFDFVALQETKCQDYAEIDLMNYSLILFEQLPQGCYHHGLGFLISSEIQLLIGDA